MKRLPKGNSKNSRTKQARLIPVAQSFKNGLVAAVADFPAPPISGTDLQAAIDSYQLALVAAQKNVGDKNATATKNSAKQNLINAMRADITYVNEIINKTYQTTPSNNYAALQALVLSTGLKPQKTVTRPNTNGVSRVANTISNVFKGPGKYGGNTNGALKIRVTAAPKYGSQRIKSFWVQYRTAAIPASGSTPAVPAGPWKDFVSTTSRIEIILLDRGKYDYMVAPVIGVFRGKDSLNWSNIQQGVVT